MILEEKREVKFVKVKKVGAIYSILIGVCMIGMWVMFYFTDGIPEIDTKPIELSMHILAELVTAVLLIIGGFSIFINKQRGIHIYLLSMGMLLYTLIMSPGYFLQKGEYGLAIMFAVFIVLAIIFIYLILKKEQESKVEL